MKNMMLTLACAAVVVALPGCKFACDRAEQKEAPKVEEVVVHEEAAPAEVHHEAAAHHEVAHNVK